VIKFFEDACASYQKTKRKPFSRS